MTTTTMAHETTTGSSSPAPRVGFREAVWFEWTKFRTVRSTVAVAGASGVVVPVLAVIVAATESLQPDDTILGASVLGGAALSQVLAAALGTIVITGELSSGMIRTTLAAFPRRLVVLAAKSVVTAAVVFVVTLPSVVAAFAIGVAMLDRDVYATGEPFPAALGIALAISSIGVLGVGIGAIVRHPAGAVAIAVAVVLLPGLLAPMMGDLERWLGGASLNGVLQKLTQSSEATPGAVGSLGPWPSLAVVAAYTVATVGGAVWVLRRRDS